MKIALDAMGGDHAPLEIVRGAVRAVESGILASQDIILCGDEPKIREILKTETSKDSSFGVHHAPEVIEMHENAVAAIRKKKNASVLGCVELVANKQADALVTMGHTGAAVAASMLGIKLLNGVRRPGLGVVFPGAKGPVFVIDVGANIKCKPIHLLHYGIMAAQCAQDAYMVKNPKVALLNIGEEEEKGNPLVKETLELFRKAPVNFIGNIEGQDIFTGVADVIVCEGFVGNVVLKVSEGVAGYMLQRFKTVVSQMGISKENEGFEKFQKAMDYSEYGAGILLGVDGVVLVGHGRSDARAVASALRLASQYVQSQVTRHIVADLGQIPASENPVSG